MTAQEKPKPSDEICVSRDALQRAAKSYKQMQSAIKSCIRETNQCETQRDNCEGRRAELQAVIDGLSTKLMMEREENIKLRHGLDAGLSKGTWFFIGAGAATVVGTALLLFL